MKNYKDSDYALNRYSAGIAYRFADGSTMTVTLEGYLADNPGKTEADFQALKELSDAIYLRQDRADNAQTKKNKPIYSEETNAELMSVTLEESYLEALDHRNAAAAFDRLMESGALTETQERRFMLHVVDGLSLRQIAKHEGVALRAIQKSVNAGADMLKKYFNNF